jgi:hypothetical protein
MMTPNAYSTNDYLRSVYSTWSDDIQTPCREILHTCCFPGNCRNSCYDAETADYFDCDPMSLDKYIGLVNWN